MENPKETHSYYVLPDWETYEEFNKWLKLIPDEEKEPFCPFECGYCNVAYSEACFECQGKDLRFDG